MSIVITQESVRQVNHQGAASRLPGVHQQSPILRLLAWYRQAVTKPISDQEKAEWQEISF